MNANNGNNGNNECNENNANNGNNVCNVCNAYNANAPFFSIIIPSHNGALRIQDALDSVRYQSFEDYEIIVVCDSCTDGTARIAANNGAKVVTVNVRNDGLARNAGLDVARGKWILFLDDDDMFVFENGGLQYLAQHLIFSNVDVMNFDFIIRNQATVHQSPKEWFVMVWSRAWRRSFIGNERFKNIKYGADVDFSRRLILENPDARVGYLDHVLYFYNYMRKGSMSWMKKNKVYLDIIVTHYDEPWEVGKPFFDMIENQRLPGHNFAITLVQDGAEKSLDWDKLFAGYSFPVRVVTAEHGGPAFARNIGIEQTDGDWIMFCGFDDMLSDVCSLRMITTPLPTDSCDIIWMKYVREQRWAKWFDDTLYINRIDSENFVYTDGKLYRREFLNQKNLRFDIGSPFFYQYIFNQVALEETTPERILMLNSDVTYPFIKTFRDNSFTRKEEFVKYYNVNTFYRDIRIIEEMNERSKDYPFRRSVAKLFCDMYYSIYCPENHKAIDEVGESSIRRIYRQLGEHVRTMSETDMAVLLDQAETEHMNVIQNTYNERKLECYFQHDGVTFQEWMKKVEEDAVKERIEEKLKEDAPAVSEPGKQKRVVVYSGTRNVYDAMATSLKSLMAHTAIDKAYFLIEDDEFSEPLPEIVECINVSHQEYFPENGPNFNSTWSYMCMMRAAYPSIFREYDKVLSLDIDIIVRDDISELWDDLNMEDAYLAGVEEPQRKKFDGDNPYINFGVVMMNLAKMRQDGIETRVINELNTNKCPCPEQDAFNRICAGNILILPNSYNVTAYSHITGDADEEKITHYAGLKFWKHFSHVKKYRDMSWADIIRRQQELHDQ